jgi:hypothetical protein
MSHPIVQFLGKFDRNEIFLHAAYLRMAQSGLIHMSWDVHGKDIDKIRALEAAGFLKATIVPSYYVEKWSQQDAIHLEPTEMTLDAIRAYEACDPYQLDKDRQYASDSTYGSM